MVAMKLTHQTSTATLIQFIALGLLNIAGTFNSIGSACRVEGAECATDIFVSVIFFLLVMAWFGFICLLGYMTEERRSRRFAQALICAELLVVLVATFNLKHRGDWLSFATSLIDLILAAWIIVLAFRVMRSGGQRITRGKPRARKRRPTSP